MAKNPHGGTPNKEWGRKARKEEDRLRGLNKAGKRFALREARDEGQVRGRHAQPDSWGRG